MTEKEETRLISELRNGDKGAFKQLFEHYYPLFFSFSVKILHDEFLADDVIQNVFVRIWVYREKLDSSRSIRNYLLVSVRNEIYAHFRNAFMNNSEPLSPDHVSASSLEDDLSASDLKYRINEVVLQMPPRRREVFMLSRVNGLSNAEIAERLGISVRTVEKHIELSLRHIRRQLSIPVILLLMIL